MPNQNMGTWLMRPVSSVAISCCAGFVDTQHSWLDKLNTQHGHFRKLRRLAMKITNRLFFRVLHALYMNHCAGNLENEILITHTPEWNWGRTHANFCWKKGTQALNKASGFVPLVSHKNYDFLSFYVYLSIYFSVFLSRLHSPLYNHCLAGRQNNARMQHGFQRSEKKKQSL